MSDALRMIKREFGEDAVILSAKTMKKGGGLRGDNRPSKVVVTAAIDKAPAVGASAVSMELKENDTQCHSAAATAGGTTYSKFSFLKRYEPITRTGQKKVKPKIVQLMTETVDPSSAGSVEERLSAQGMSQQKAAELADQINGLLSSDQPGHKEERQALAQALDALQLIGPARKRRGKKPRVVVMTGPSGVGKTSAAVKLAARHVIDYRETVGMISLDNQRIAGACELERYAGIMGLPLKMVHDATQAAQALSSFETADLVVVDTPGLTLEDHYLLQLIKDSLSGLENAELHLLISATAQEKVMAKTISFFRSLNIERLLFTQLDWALDIGPMINQTMVSKVPISYLCDSPKVPDGMRAATADEIAAMLLPESGASTTPKGVNAVAGSHRTIAREKACYVANRNSDIFHHNSCKSVKRIHSDNMMMFKDPAEAMGQQFKPCRMCCSDLISTKPIERPARRYAGNRC